MVGKPSSNALRILFVALVVLPTLSCDSLGGFLTLLGRNVTVIIENDTSYTAEPELWTSDSRNLIEDIFSESDQITDFGDDGEVRPRSTATIHLTCDSDLELIAFRGVVFRESGLRIGSIDTETRLRRDTDFDCGDTIHIRFSGTLFDFDVDIDVDQAPGNDDDDDSRDGRDDDDDLADALDDLFGH